MRTENGLTKVVAIASYVSSRLENQHFRKKIGFFERAVQKLNGFRVL